MKIKKHVLVLIAILIAAALVLSACGGKTNPDDGFVSPGDNLGGGGTGTVPSETDSPTAEGFLLSDLTELSLDVSYGGATVINGSDQPYVIEAAGSYVLKGAFTAGVTVSVANGEIVHLFLNGAEISCSDGVALSDTNKKSSLIVTAVAGTENTVSNTDGGNAVHVKGDLSVNGTGKISVSSTSKNAVKVTKSFVMVDATMVLSATNHALSARSVEIQNASLTVENAGKDGINAECDDDTQAFPENYDEGFVALKNSVVDVTVSGDGIQADTLVYIDGGNVKIKTNGTFVGYSSENLTEYGLEFDDFRFILSGGKYQKVASDSHNRVSSMYALTQSSKGIKVGEIKYENTEGQEIAVTEGNYLIVITGNAQMNIDSSDDAIHTNSGSVSVLSGNIVINTLDDGITSDLMTQIDGGNIDIQSSYEGIEGAYVKITGGTINIVSSDDGINAASDDRTIKEYIVINGGNITVNAAGDGVDSNGSILMTGGVLIVHGPTSGMDAALDADTGIVVQGGTLFAASSLGMVETPSQNSTQKVLSYAQRTSIAAGSVVTVKDSSGNELVSVTVKKACQSIIVSSSDFVEGNSYAVYVDGTELTTFTVSGTITSVGTTGGQGGGPGGGPGGRPGRR